MQKATKLYFGLYFYIGNSLQISAENLPANRASCHEARPLTGILPMLLLIKTRPLFSLMQVIGCLLYMTNDIIYMADLCHDGYKW